MPTARPWRRLAPTLFLSTCLATACAAPPERSGAGLMLAADAWPEIESGRMTLVDVSAPEDVARDGAPAGAHLIPYPVGPDADGDRFAAAVARALGGDRDRPVALVCRMGVTARAARDALRARGFAAVTALSDGMLGSEAGPGWIQWGLPMAQRPGP